MSDNTHQAQVLDIDDDRRDDEYDDDDRACWYCGGDGWGVIGQDWSNPDPGWWNDGDIQKCPNCGGSGDANDCTFW